MKTWYKLTPEEITKIYCVPAEIANNPNNHFWGLAYHYPQELFEGDWPLVALRRNEGYPSVVTLQIHTLPMELLHASSRRDEKEKFNPLETTGGGNYLIRLAEEIKGLCKILQAQKALFADDGSTVAKQSVFRLLRDDEVRFYRLHPEWFPDDQRSAYIQVVQPATTVALSSISLLIVSIPSGLNDKMTFKIMTFEKKDLLDKSFTPLSRAQSKLYLHWSGLLEVIDLLSQAMKRAR